LAGNESDRESGSNNVRSALVLLPFVADWPNAVRNALSSQTNGAAWHPLAAGWRLSESLWRAPVVCDAMRCCDQHRAEERRLERRGERRGKSGGGHACRGRGDLFEARLHGVLLLELSDGDTHTNEQTTISTHNSHTYKHTDRNKHT
jgi:hypothetical protein